MPKALRKRLGAHAMSVKLANRQFAVQDGPAIEDVEIGALAESSGTEILDTLKEAELQPTLKKKAKQQLKRDFFMQRLESSNAPYSKSHGRRLKRKAREQVAGGLTDIQAVISSMDETQGRSSFTDHNADNAASSHSNRTLSRQPKFDLIGEGKGVPLTKKQRKRTLAIEQLRQPLILANPDFSLNPFQTIRTHAENTLLKHKTSS